MTGRGAISAAGLTVEVDGVSRRVEISRDGESGEWIAVLDGTTISMEARLVQPGILSLILNGRAYRCVLDEGPVETAIHIAGRRYLVAIDNPRSLTARRRKAETSGGLEIIKAPMPGRIVRVLVAIGDEVVAQQGVVVIEAMKMQNELKAARAGKVVAIRAEAGTSVTAGAILMEIE